ncbi:MAG: prephenate dehydrogenase/arogenate dehydrogenase family protein [Acidimicrobiia bacterium]
MPQAAIIGTGLIGASIGLALREQGWATRGWDPASEAMDVAVERGAVEPADSIRQAIEGVDLVVLAGPLSANVETLGALDTDALITDVTSVKQPLITQAPARLRFVGGHPMAGREHAGAGAASGSLFRGAAWILCDDTARPEDLARMQEIVASVGANPVIMSAEHHDRVVAAISHLPHLLAVALVELVAENPDTVDLVSGSFRDLTRVASAESAWWPEVLTANSSSVGDALDGLIGHLQTLRRDIDSGDLDSVAGSLDRARLRRAEMAPPVAGIEVILADRPGEIGRVGHALQTSRVDVRDLQLRHAVHGGGGILTISVRPGEVETLKAALTREGFEVEEQT